MANLKLMIFILSLVFFQSIREIPQSRYMQIAAILVYQNKLRHSKSQSRYRQCQSLYSI